MATTDSKQIIRALYDDDDVILKAVKDVREKGHRVTEVYSPFPIHGLDHAMGLKPTRIAIASFMYGCAGLTTAILMTWFMMNHDWPQNIGGKPSMTWAENMPAFVPVMFELTVFFAAHLMVWTYFAVNKLYPGAERQNPDKRTTDDKFMMEVPVSGNREELVELLKTTGAIEINDANENA